MSDKYHYYKLLVAWKSLKNRTNYAVGTLELHQDYYQFYYNQDIYKEALKEGFEPFVGLSDAEKIYRSSKLFPSFERRIPSKTRNDFKRFLKENNINSANVEWEYLCITQGRLVTDSIFFVTPIIYDADAEVAFGYVDLAGWSETKYTIKDYSISDKVNVRVDANNPYDSEAMEVILEGKSGLKLGYIPRPFNTLFHRMYTFGMHIQTSIIAKNPKDDRPIIALTCKMNRELFTQQKDLHYMIDIQSSDLHHKSYSFI